MKYLLLASVMALMPLTAQIAQAKENSPKISITRESLLKGSPVPEKRDFPLSTKVSPCEDFHKYVCEEAETKFKLPADRERWTFSFTDIAERLLYAKKVFFKNIDTYTPTSERTAQFKDVYLSCMNEKSSAKEEQEDVAKEKAIIAKIKTWQELADLSQARVDQGQTSFLEFDIGANKENPLHNDAFLTADMRTLPERSYYEKKDLMADFEKILVDFFKTIKVDQPEQRAKWVVAFETGLAMKYPLPKDMRERFTEKRDISRADFLKKYPNLKADRFMARLPEKTVLIDIVPESNEYINNALATLPIEELKSVYMFHDMVDLLDDAYPAFFKKFFNFKHKYLGGAEKRPPRQERCTKWAMHSFGDELDEGLLPILFPNFPEDRVVRIGETMRATIIKGLNKNGWLASSTKKEAAKKIETAKLFLVKPKEEKDWNFMPVKKYNQARPHDNMVLYAKTMTEKNLKELSEDRSPTRWDMPPLVVNAYYNPPDNKFVLLQGILQFPFFDPNLSDIENMAAIGTVVGHELGHGIDDQGSKYDYSGKVRQWFTPKDLENFSKRGARFIDQFNKIGHDGKLTLGENIGDHVGLTFSYNAAFADPAQASPENKKKFFVAYARMWCNVATPSSNERQIKTNPHSLGQERINQQVVHIDGFYDAYSCKAGDKMFVDAKDRIHVWQ